MKLRLTFLPGLLIMCWLCVNSASKCKLWFCLTTSVWSSRIEFALFIWVIWWPTICIGLFTGTEVILWSSLCIQLWVMLYSFCKIELIICYQSCLGHENLLLNKIGLGSGWSNCLYRFNLSFWLLNLGFGLKFCFKIP